MKLNKITRDCHVLLSRHGFTIKANGTAVDIFRRGVCIQSRISQRDVYLFTQGVIAVAGISPAENPPVQIKTLSACHVEQLPYVHDENYDFTGKTILGSHAGFLIVKAWNGTLERVSITVYVLQQTPRVGHAAAYQQGNFGFPQLFVV